MKIEILIQGYECQSEKRQSIDQRAGRIFDDVRYQQGSEGANEQGERERHWHYRTGRTRRLENEQRLSNEGGKGARDATRDHKRGRNETRSLPSVTRQQRCALA